MASNQPPEPAGASPVSATHMSSNMQNYPNPFFDLATLELPNNIKELLRYARYYFYAEPLVHTTCRKMAEYPITDLIIQGDEEAEEQWEDVYEQLEMKSFLIQVSLDYHAYGNCFITPHFPKKRELKCQETGDSWDFTQFEEIRFRNEHFVAECPKCEKEHPMDSVEYKDQRVKKINLLRWDPLNMEIVYNEITGEKTFYYDIPNEERNRIREGDTDYLSGVPTEFIQAAYEDNKVKVNPDMIYHLHRETLAQRGDGWGRPLCYPVMKYLYYLSVLRKSQEVIANERAVPKRFLYPESQGQSNPFIDQNLGKWRSEVEKALEQWKNDPGFVKTFPFPVGEGAIGGDAKSLLLTPEINNTIQQIVTGMGVPQEFVFGGLKWTGSSISLRMIENKMLNLRRDLKKALDFVNRKLKNFLDLPDVEVRFQDFKMADDMKRKKMAMQLNNQKKVSDKTLLSELDYDFEEEQKKMLEEVDQKQKLVQKQALNSARMKGIVGKIMGEYKTEAMSDRQREKIELKKELSQSAGLAAQQMGAGKQNPKQAAEEIERQTAQTLQGSNGFQQLGKQVTGQLDKMLGDGGQMVANQVMQELENAQGGQGKPEE